MADLGNEAARTVDAQVVLEVEAQFIEGDTNGEPTG